MPGTCWRAPRRWRRSLGRQSDRRRAWCGLALSVAGGRFLAPRLPVLLARYPGLRVELVMRDQFSDMVEERLDLAIRSGEIADASLVARRVGQARARRGRRADLSGAARRASVPADLAAHTCLIHDSAPDSGAVALHRPGRSGHRAGDRRLHRQRQRGGATSRPVPATASRCCRRSR